MKILHGDSLEVLKSLDSNSIDSLVTDPPAGISFMGKEWDSHKGGREEWINWLSQIMKEALRVLKPGAHGLVWSLPRTSHWTATALELAGFEVRDCISHLFGSGFPKSHDISKGIDKMKGAEREIVGYEKYSAPDIRGNSYDQAHVSNRERLGVSITKAKTAEAKQWEGWGTALKPAAELWWLVRKPLSEKTVAQNVLKWGVGGINIDGCRVGLGNEKPPRGSGKINDLTKNTYGNNWKKDGGNETSLLGRFPANLVFSHTPYCTEEQCDLECAIKMLDEQSGISRSDSPKRKPKYGGHKNVYVGGELKKNITAAFYTDIGGASRFFYCAKVSSSERGDSNHPTMKSIKLMSYLCRLVTPPNGIVLDPFMGSGSTGLAAQKEGFRFIGIEKEKEYFEIAEKRIKAPEVSP